MEKGAGLAEEARLTLEFSLSFSLLLPLVNKNTFFLIGIFFQVLSFLTLFVTGGWGSGREPEEVSRVAKEGGGRG